MRLHLLRSSILKKLRLCAVKFAMARIRVPKPFSQLTQEIKSEAWIPLMSKYHATDKQGRYLHWDEFQWRVDPGDDVMAA